MAAASELQVQLPGFQYKKNWDQAQLEVLGNDQGIVSICDTRYCKVNPTQTMEELIMCAEMLQLALTAAGNQKCSVPILEILSNYHSLTSAASSATSTFVLTSIDALKKHKLAGTFFEASQKPGKTDEQKAKAMEKGLSYFDSCRELAGEMSKIAGDLEKATGVLEGKAEEAMLLAQDEKVQVDGQKSKLSEKIDQMKVKKAKLEENVKQATTRAQQAESDNAGAAKHNEVLESSIRKEYDDTMSKYESQRAAIQAELDDAFEKKDTGLASCFSTSNEAQGDAEKKRQAVLAAERVLMSKENALADLEFRHTSELQALKDENYQPKLPGITPVPAETASKEKRGTAAAGVGAVAAVAGGPVFALGAAAVACHQFLSANQEKQAEEAKKIKDEHDSKQEWDGEKQKKIKKLVEDYEKAKQTHRCAVENQQKEVDRCRSVADMASTSIDSGRAEEFRKVEEAFVKAKAKAEGKFKELDGNRQMQAQKLRHEEAMAAEMIKKNLERQDEAKKLAREATRQQHEENALLQECLAGLENNHTQHNDLDKTLSCLGIVVQTMGKVKVTFGAVKLFWDCVKLHSASLQDYGKEIQDLCEVEEMDEVFEQIQGSAQGWACLGYMNNRASQSILAASEKVKGVMNALPAGDAHAKTMELVQNMKQKVEAEDAKIQQDLKCLEILDEI